LQQFFEVPLNIIRDNTTTVQEPFGSVRQMSAMNTDNDIRFPADTLLPEVLAREDVVEHRFWPVLLVSQS